jgi:DHA1 family bicyclomycin/chloramphenicol resistance-like MFS transporter
MDSKVDAPIVDTQRKTEVRFLDNTTPPHLITLVLATATAALSTNLFLPSLPGMAVYFNTDYGIIQLTVSLYLAAQAVLQLGIGPASDRFGRLPVMLFGFAIFLVSTLAAIWAPNIETLLACRLLQAFAACGMVLSRAIVRDTAEPADAASRLGYVMMCMTVAPMIGPMIGGFLDEIYGWKASFYMMAAFGILAVFIIYKDLGETNPYQSPSMLAQIKAYPEVIKSRRFWGYSLTAACSSGAFFAFIGGGPFVSTEILGLSPTAYGVYFGTISVGYAVGNYLSSRMTRRVGINLMMQIGNVVGFVSMLGCILLFLVGLKHPFALFGPMVFVGMGSGLTNPNAATGMVSIRPRLAGSASGLGGSIQIAGGAAFSVLAGLFLSKESGPYPLLIVMTSAVFMGILATAYVMRVARQAGDI